MTAVQITLIVVVLLAVMNVVFIIRERRQGVKFKPLESRGQVLDGFRPTNVAAVTVNYTLTGPVAVAVSAPLGN